jgi:hypothetical protein
MIKTSIIVFVLLYMVSAHSQQTIEKLNANQLKLPKETISKALSVDATGQVKSSATSDTELGYLSGTTSSVQTQINSKINDSDAVHLTGNESISGVKTFTGRLETSSTTNASLPCPVMTQSQRDLVASPVAGFCVFNSDTLLSNIYDGSLWKAMGGSGGGISLWITATGYAVDDVVIESNKIYICLTAHTSGTFATDLASVYWLRVSTDVSGATGVLPLANGGTNKNATASNGAIVYSDTDSFELLAAGTSGQVLQTNGAAAPTFVNKSISGKAQNKTAVTSEEIQFPNNLLTETGTNKYLSESGNKNILDNPSFEHSTFSTSWTNSAGTFTQETSIVIDGKASAKLVLAAQTMSLTQSSTLYEAQFADGVQGLVMVRIKSDIALSVCSIQAGTVSTTNCVVTNTDSKWGLYKVPFILGATSNGVSIASSGSVTGTVYIDDAFVGAVDLKQDINNVGPWIAYTPTIVGTTAGSISFEWRQVGDNVEVRGTFTSTTPTASIGTITLPNSYTTRARGAIIQVGEWTQSSSNIFMGTVLAPTTSLNTLNFGISGSGSNGLTALAGTAMWSSPSLNTSVKFSVPVTELAGSSSVYTASCGVNCMDSFSAKFDDSGVTSQENITSFINGNASLATSTYTITFGTGIFTVAPNCVATRNRTATTGELTVNSISSTTLVIQTTNSSGSNISSGFFLLCQKQGVDFTATRTIQGSFNEVVTSPGISKPKVCHYAFGGAAATLAAPTECTTGTCVEVYDSCGTGSPPSWATTALYSAITWASGTWANSSYIECRCTGFDVTTGATRECLPSFTTAQNSWSTNSSGGYVTSVYGDNGGGIQATMYTQITCTGQAP